MPMPFHDPNSGESVDVARRIQRRSGRVARLAVASWAVAIGAGLAGLTAGGAGGLSASSGWGAGAAQPGARPTDTIGDDAWSRAVSAFGGTTWVSKPSRDSAMRFTIPMEVREVSVKPGDAVKKGQRLVRGRDAEIVASLEVQKARAENTGEVQVQKAACELAKLRFDRAQEAMDGGAMKPQEFDEIRLGYEASKGNLDAAEKRLKEEQLRVDQVKGQAERYYLEAPFDGLVESLSVEVGQGVNENEPVIRVVDIDPLWVDVPVSAAETLTLELASGKRAWVLLDIPGREAPVIEGTIDHVSPVVDSASGTLRVRVVVPNARLLPAGTRACVRFGEPKEGWDKGLAAAGEATGSARGATGTGGERAAAGTAAGRSAQ